MYEEPITDHSISLKLPQRGETSFSLVASLPDDVDWDDVEGVMYELGGDFAGTAIDFKTPDYGKLILQPTVEGLFAIMHNDNTYKLYLADEGYH